MSYLLTFMIGALLILFFLALVFLTQPNKKRDRYMLELWRAVKKSLRRRISKKRVPLQVSGPLAVKRSNKIPIITIDGKPYRPTIFDENPVSIELAELPNEPNESINPPVITDHQSEADGDTSPAFFTELLEQPLETERLETKIKAPQPVVSEQPMTLTPKLEIKKNENAEHHISLDAVEMTDNYPANGESKIEVMYDQHSNAQNDQNTANTKQMKEINLDDSIIDIDQTYQLVDYGNIENQQTQEVPEWPHTYIYSYTDLDRATTIQVKFYHKLKEKFLQGGWIDIGTNSNYAFILLFNILRDFNTHQDIKLLEQQFNRLGGYFPKTASYANRFLIQKMRDIGDTDGLDRLEWSIISNRTDLQSWDWKERYIKRLGLSKADAKLLDDFYPPSNSFLWNDTCATEVLKLYIQLRRELQLAFKNNKLEQVEEFAPVLDILARKQYNYRTGSQNYQYTIKNGASTIWDLMFKYCEAKTRQHYGCTKIFSFLPSYHPEFLASLKQHITSHVEQKVEELVQAIPQATEELEIALNTTLTTRWKVGFDLSQTYYEELGKEAFLARAEEILRWNAKNPSLELIHLEISKQLMLCDRQLSFDHYLKYVGQNLNGSRLVLKTMSQKMIKKLFSTPEQQTLYFTLMTALIRREFSVEDALVQIKDFYLPKRKKISLNTLAIKTVENQHSGTVQLLNEYLSGEDVLLEEQPVEIAGEKQVEIHNYTLDLSQLEMLLITLFSKNGFKLNTDQLAAFCRENGTMAGPLVNNLNETCYELLDDLLIEQQEENYTINPTYYAQITT